MKPRIFLFHGVWHCFARGRRVMGLGFTPSEAYFDWLKA
jgi:hypothetical protein